jgi:hypothetical protein
VSNGLSKSGILLNSVVAVTRSVARHDDGDGSEVGLFVGLDIVNGSNRKIEKQAGSAEIERLLLMWFKMREEKRELLEVKV